MTTASKYVRTVPATAPLVSFYELVDSLFQNEFNTMNNISRRVYTDEIDRTFDLSAGALFEEATNLKTEFERKLQTSEKLKEEYAILGSLSSSKDPICQKFQNINITIQDSHRVSKILAELMFVEIFLNRKNTAPLLQNTAFQEIAKLNDNFLYCFLSLEQALLMANYATNTIGQDDIQDYLKNFNFPFATTSKNNLFPIRDLLTKAYATKTEKQMVLGDVFKTVTGREGNGSIPEAYRSTVATIGYSLTQVLNSRSGAAKMVLVALFHEQTQEDPIESCICRYNDELVVLCRTGSLVDKMYQAFMKERQCNDPAPCSGELVTKAGYTRIYKDRTAPKGYNIVVETNNFKKFIAQFIADLNNRHNSKEADARVRERKCTFETAIAIGWPERYEVSDQDLTPEIIRGAEQKLNCVDQPKAGYDMMGNEVLACEQTPASRLLETPAPYPDCTTTSGSGRDKSYFINIKPGFDVAICDVDMNDG